MKKGKEVFDKKIKEYSLIGNVGLLLGLLMNLLDMFTK